MPTCPIANPSQTAIAGKTIGTPPPSATPCFTASTILSRFMWPGTISFFELTTPINGRPISSSQRPKAFKRARCGAALTPSFKGALLTGWQGYTGNNGFRIWTKQRDIIGSRDARQHHAGRRCETDRFCHGIPLLKIESHNNARFAYVLAETFNSRL